MIKCTSVMGHKYRPRYDTEPAHSFRVESISRGAMLDLMDRNQKKTYVHDICERCGHVIQRSSQ